jgi:uncharacterized membrane protein YeaQ/YmgE (transglycosylase-associated protein family)
MFAQIDLPSTGIIAWVVVGLAAGAFAGLVLRGEGAGSVVVEMGLGMVGALVGGVLFALIAPGFWAGGIVAALVGAGGLIAALRGVKPAPGRF